MQLKDWPMSTKSFSKRYRAKAIMRLIVFLIEFRMMEKLNLLCLSALVQNYMM